MSQESDKNQNHWILFVSFRLSETTSSPLIRLRTASIVLFSLASLTCVNSARATQSLVYTSASLECWFSIWSEKITLSFSLLWYLFVNGNLIFWRTLLYAMIRRFSLFKHLMFAFIAFTLLTPGCAIRAILCFIMERMTRSFSTFWVTFNLNKCLFTTQ